VSRVSILLADDNSAVLNHVTRTLRKEYDIVAAVTDGESVLKQYPRLRPDVIVLDISMGDLSGIDVARRLRDSGCHSKIVFLTVHEDSDFVNAAMGTGASAYVVKSRMSTDLVSAIEAALAGKLFVSGSLLYGRS
jgi:DNA-binding NarL/FixJ family response regulator